MTPIVAPLDDLLLPEGQEPEWGQDQDQIIEGNSSSSSSSSSSSRRDSETKASSKKGGKALKMVSVGIGDGGNEVGMGSVYQQVIKSSVPMAAEIACVVPVDHLLVSSVSNWGSYALGK